MFTEYLDTILSPLGDWTRPKATIPLSTVAWAPICGSWVKPDRTLTLSQKSQ
jgi:hypothetical protein